MSYTHHKIGEARIIYLEQGIFARPLTGYFEINGGAFSVKDGKIGDGCIWLPHGDHPNFFDICCEMRDCPSHWCRHRDHGD